MIKYFEIVKQTATNCWIKPAATHKYDPCKDQQGSQTTGMRKWVHFLAAARQFPAQKSKGKHAKQPVSRKINEKKKKNRSKKSAKRKESRQKEDLRLYRHKVY